MFLLNSIRIFVTRKTGRSSSREQLYSHLNYTGKIPIPPETDFADPIVFLLANLQRHGDALGVSQRTPK